MSAAQRAGNGGSGYYTPAGGDVVARQRQEEAAAAAWRSGFYTQGAGASWPGGGAGGGAAGPQNSPCPNYNPSSWSCSSHPRPPYHPNYQGGSERMEPYANGSYGPHYTQASMNAQYPGCPPPNPYYPPPSQPPYPVDPYKQASGTHQAPPHWGYTQHGGHNISPQAPSYPQYPSHQDAMPPYPYCETTPGLPQQAMPQQNPQGEGWGVYGAHNHYQWPTAPPVPPSQSGNHYVSGSRPAWQGADVQPGTYDTKDDSQASSYNRQRPYQNYPDNPQANPTEHKPNPPNPHYSASPQMYNRKDPASQESRATEVNPSHDNSSIHPGILKINQVLERIVDLEREVDEFVGKKTDMSYRCLEELLTKELLELDSVETSGLDNVRQARREAVKKLQSIIENLERKGL
ncbi:BAG family molecular chaperone regulator 4 [Pelobates fuscus]|uniref:BAG family molecular chaperone regulator 4 n=1 Tax=Pelobates fuscus TaxID=191477 RepID=UPI002FE4CE90